MTIITRIGQPTIKVLWGLIALAGAIFVSSGFVNTIQGIRDFGNSLYSSPAPISQISIGIIAFILGLIAMWASYLGNRGRIIITTSEDKILFGIQHKTDNVP